MDPYDGSSGSRIVIPIAHSPIPCSGQVVEERQQGRFFALCWGHGVRA